MCISIYIYRERERYTHMNISNILFPHHLLALASWNMSDISRRKTCQRNMS